jgi:hypothetical protein
VGGGGGRRRREGGRKYRKRVKDENEGNKKHKERSYV